MNDFVSEDPGWESQILNHLNTVIGLLNIKSVQWSIMVPTTKPVV